MSAAGWPPGSASEPASWAAGRSPYPPPPPPKIKRTRQETLSLIGGITVMVLGLALRIVLRFWLLPDDEHARPADVPTMAPTHPYADTFSAQEMVPGTCLDRVPLDFVRAVPCGQSHIAEIVAFFPHPAPPGAAYPSTLDVLGQYLDRCKAEFRTYAGTASGQGPATPYVAAPGRFEWDRGERRVVCYATARDGGPLTSTVRGSAA